MSGWISFLCLIPLATAAQPALPEMPGPRTFYFVVTATDASGATSDWSPELATTNVPGPVCWLRSDTPGITNYTLLWSLRSGGQTNERRSLYAGTNLWVTWPPATAPATNIITITAVLRITTPQLSPLKLFALCSTTNLSAPVWQPVPEATNAIITSQ